MMTQGSGVGDMAERTILVVEDEQMVRMPIAEYLRECGYTVLEAGDAGEAIALVDASDHIDAVFSDVQMPGKMDGFGLARWITQNHPEVPVLLTSGYNSARSLSAEATGKARLIEKPYSQAQVARRIEALIDSR